jgi:hypothetical protein
MKTQTKGRPITFRLYPEDEELLREHAPAGTKALGPTAEKLLLQKIRNADDLELGYLRQKIVQLEGQLQNIHEDLIQKMRNGHDPEVGSLHQRVVDLENQLQNVHEDLKASVEAILLAVVNPNDLSTQNVKEWVKKKLRKE